MEIQDIHNSNLGFEKTKKLLGYIRTSRRVLGAGLFEFLDDGYMIPYSPSFTSIEDFENIFKTLH